jgi:hypothetical protein
VGICGKDGQGICDVMGVCFWDMDGKFGMGTAACTIMWRRLLSWGGRILVLSISVFMSGYGGLCVVLQIG